ncbi:MmgE/PrpD family protein [Flavimaricola marinus]|uniref:MmgE/PrpD family protein n=1 Tax=Flavimaricola marinus TaxID=1819565 RepID=A0A238LCG4_9RHOB|nr:MmgE/PrpD family protein [Flavimaricola marinus]SMY07379.1 MmgE/PrpD family protein [Flavimaricola marinus]
MMDIPKRLTDFVDHHWQASAIPAASLDLMRLCLLDWAIVARGAVDDGLREPMAAHAQAAGPGRAALLFGGTAPARSAALHNGTLSHALDFDDTHFGHIGHVSTVVIPAALAAGQAGGSGFDDILIGARLGAEAATRVGLWLGRSHYQIGYHQTATSGAFGATVAAIRAARHDPQLIGPATRIVAGLSSGLKAQFGTAMKPMNAGFAAAHGVEAADLAALGLDGSQDVMAAFAATHHGAADESGFDTLGSDWIFDSVSHKFHACCHGTHAAIEAIREGIADLGAPLDEVAQVEIQTHPRWMTVCNKPAPQTALEEKFSYRFLAALTLAGGSTMQVDAAKQGPLGAMLPQILDRVGVTANEDVSETATRVTLTLYNGETREITHDLATPLSYETRLARLTEKGQETIGPEPTQALWEAIQGGDLDGFVTLLTQPAA